MAKIFISYSSHDEAIAKQIGSTLDLLHIEHFLDKKNISVGANIANEIQYFLDNCIGIILLISKNSISSKWVHYEIGYAQALKKIVLPVVIDDIAIEKVPHYINALLIGEFADLETTIKKIFVERVTKLSEIADMATRSAQMIVFSGSQIDDRFWIQHWGNVSSKMRPLDRLMYALESRRSNHLTLDPEHNYHLMLMLDYLNGNYLATAYAEELTSSESQEYIYNISAKYANRITRIFIIEHIKVLKYLDRERKQQLSEQIELGCNLYYCIKDNPSMYPNVAIYGETAVGTLQADGRNSVNFSIDNIKNEIANYHNVLSSSVRITKTLIQELS